MTPSGQEKIRVCCPACGKAFQVASQYAGKKARCTGCQTVIVIPAPEAPPAASNDLSDLLDETYPTAPGPLPAKPEAAPETAPPPSAPVLDPRLRAMERAYEREFGEKDKNAPRPTEELFRGVALMGAAGATGFILVCTGFMIPFSGYLTLCVIAGFFMGLFLFVKGIFKLLTGRK